MAVAVDTWEQVRSADAPLIVDESALFLGIAGDFAAVQLNIKYFKAKIKIAPFAANNG